VCLVRKKLRRWELAGALLTGAAAAFGAAGPLPPAAFLAFTAAEFAAFADPLRNFLAVKAASLLAYLLVLRAASSVSVPPWAEALPPCLAAVLAYALSFRLLTAGALRGGAWQLAGLLFLVAALLGCLLCALPAL